MTSVMTDRGEDVVSYDDVLHTSSQERFLFSQFSQFPVNSNSMSVLPFFFVKAVDVM